MKPCETCGGMTAPDGRCLLLDSERRDIIGEHGETVGWVRERQAAYLYRGTIPSLDSNIADMDVLITIWGDDSAQMAVTGPAGTWFVALEGERQ